MAEFICRNKQCPMDGIVSKIGDVTYRMVEMSLKADERFCKTCGEEREEVKIKKEMGFNISEIGNPDKNFGKPVRGKTIY